MKAEKTYRVADDTRGYFFMMPNMIDDIGLSVYAFRLYGRLKRVAGDKGHCDQSTRTLADACQMSTASVSRAKQELLTAGLIRISTKKRTYGGMDYHEITIVDIWAENVSRYQVTGSNLDVTGSNLQVSPQKLASYPSAIKEEHFKKNPEEEEESPAASAGVVYRSYEKEIGSLTPTIQGKLEGALEDYPEGWIVAAFEEAALNNKRSWKYAEAILKRWKNEGFQTRKPKSNGNGNGSGRNVVKNEDGSMYV